MKTILTIALLLAPTFAIAEGGCSDRRMQIEASSCAEGSTWDAAKGVCLPLTTS